MMWATSKDERDPSCLGGSEIVEKGDKTVTRTWKRMEEDSSVVEVVEVFSNSNGTRTLTHWYRTGLPDPVGPEVTSG